MRITSQTSFGVSWLMLLFAGLFTAGCSSTSIIYKETKTVDLSKGSYVLLTVHATNEVKPNYRPFGTRIRVITERDGKFEKRNITLNSTVPPATTPRELQLSTNQFINFQLPPGKHVIKEIYGGSWRGLIASVCSIPLLTSFDLQAGQVVYLGHIEAVSRPRTGEELRSGPVIPLIDQAVSGFASGSFDIRIQDNFESDVATFKAKLPVLRSQQIEKGLLPNWQRRTRKDLDDAEKREEFGRVFQNGRNVP